MNIKKTIILFFVVFSLIFGQGIFNVALLTEARTVEFVDVLVSFNRVPGQYEHGIIERAGGSVKSQFSVVPAFSARIPRVAISGLLRNPRILAIEEDGLFWAEDFETELDNTWGVKRIQAGEVHKSGNFGQGVKVAVIDTGIDYSHPELSGIYAGGYDFVNNDHDPMDDNGHGTHVAGTIASARDGNGVVGVSPEIELYALKVLGSDGSGSFSNIISAIDWALENGIQITNNSYGSSSDPGSIVKLAFDNSYEAGILHVSSAGNSGNPAGKGDNVGYPARWESVIAVVATDQKDSRARFSSTGPSVELSAPGVSINSTWLGGLYRIASGTSMASPHVAGTAALVWSAYPEWTNQQIRVRLRETAQYLGAINQYGYGLVDALKASGEIQEPTDPPEEEPDPPLEGPEDEPKCPPGLAKKGQC